MLICSSDCCQAFIRHGELIESRHTDESSDQIKLQSRTTCSSMMVCAVVKS